MHWHEISLRTRLLLSYWQFDLSINSWEKTLRGGELNPFTHAGFAKSRPGLTVPKHWQTLLDAPIKNGAVTYQDPDYPAAFTALDDRRPPVIYRRGSAIPKVSSLVAIVGTRNPTFNGRRNAELFSFATANKGVGVVSGLARGIDSIAHRYSMKPYTLAVLGSGISTIYPRENRDLAEDILASGGTLLSPFPDSQIIQKSNFPRRNLHIAALSAGAIVIEGALTSGAVVTGKLALSLDRDVAVLTQDFQSSAGQGAIALMRVGASPATSPEDALRIIAARRHDGLQPLTISGQAVMPPSEFTLDEWIDRYGDAPHAIRELEARVHDGRVVPIGAGIYRSNA